MDRFEHDFTHLEELLDSTRVAGQQFVEGLRQRPAAQPPTTIPEALVLPDEGLGAQIALDLFRSRYEAGLSASPGPRYLGFVTGGSTPAALAGDWLASAYDQNLSNDGDSIASSVERETLAMLRQLFGMSDRFHGAMVSGATQANLVALATARQWVGERLGVDVSSSGLAGLGGISVLAGSAHASVFKALSVLGLGRQSVEAIDRLPDRMAVDPRALEERLRSLEGRPAIVVASAGDVNTGDFDDLEAVGELCREHGAWLHVDGAFGLFAACDPERAHLLAGLEQANSVATDGHKWLNVPYDSGIVFTRHLALQEKVFKAVAAYLGDGPDLLHRTPENSRRFRALPAWATLMAYGREGYRDLVRRNCAQAQALGERLAASEHFELLAPVRLDVVCFALREGDATRRDRLIDFLAHDGRAYLTPTHFEGRPGLRAAFVNWMTRDDDVETVFEALEEGATEVGL